MEALEATRASIGDVDEIRQSICDSARQLSRGYYSERQITAAITQVFGIDTTLIADATYFVTRVRNRVVGCGGWSKR